MACLEKTTFLLSLTSRLGSLLIHLFFLMCPLLDQVQYLTLKEQALPEIYLTLWTQYKHFN